MELTFTLLLKFTFGFIILALFFILTNRIKVVQKANFSLIINIFQKTNITSAFYLQTPIDGFVFKRYCRNFFMDNPSY
jgi:hypothetical protein